MHLLKQELLVGVGEGLHFEGQNVVATVHGPELVTDNVLDGRVLILEGV